MILEGIGMAHCNVPQIPLTDRLTFTIGEAAGLLGISVATAYEERARGRLHDARRLAFDVQHERSREHIAELLTR